MKKQRILKVGRNCWRIRRADKVAFLIDGANYFKALYDSLPLAQQQIMVLSWDIYSQLALVPKGGSSSDKSDTERYPVVISDLLDHLVSQKSDLYANILSWDFSLLVSLSREWLPIYKLDWKTHRRLKFHMDDKYPVGASHHQKVVVIDDALAFSGGLDLTRGRWDTHEHHPDNPQRAEVDGSSLPIKPYHDVQMAVSGSAAAALGSLARERWRRATDKELPAPEQVNTDIWAPGLQADMEDVDVAIVRTEPAYEEYTGIDEVKQLYLDSIAAAQDYIYIENQFFTAPAIGNALAESLARADGPEIILNFPLATDGWLSQQSLDMMRVELIRGLRKADKHGRLAVYYPESPASDELAINLHAKIMIMDNRFVRVGSSNLNNRSMGLDTECDLAIEVDPTEEENTKAIQLFLTRLLGEHLDCGPDEVKNRFEEEGSLLKAIESLRGKERTLEPLEPRLPEPDVEQLQKIRLADPEHPVDSDKLLNRFVPATQSKSAGRRIAGWIAMLALLLMAAAAWRFTPLNDWLDVDMLTEIAAGWRHSAITPLIVIAAFVVGGLLVMPVTALIIVSVLVFGSITGFLYAVSGSFISALCGYGLGYLLGRNTVRQLAGGRLNRVSRQMAKRGILTMIVVRIVPVAPFTVVNLIAGASHIRFRDFVLGTVFGMTPGILGVTLLTDRVTATLQSPSWETLLTLIAVAAVIFTAGYQLSKRLLDKEKAAMNTAKNKSDEKAGAGA